MNINEVLNKSHPIEKWIKDFVDSDNPKFSGKSKEERIKMAKGAYYSAQKEDISIDEETKKEDLPFDPDPPKKNPSAKAGKYGLGHSVAKHLARQALKKQQGVKEETEEQKKEKEALDLKLAKAKNSQRAAKALGEDISVDEEFHVVGNNSYYGDKQEPVKLSSHKTKDEADAALAKHKAASKTEAGNRTKWHKVVDSNSLKKHMKEEIEELDELDKKTLGSYVNKAHNQLMKHTSTTATKFARGDKDATAYALDKDALRKTANRTQGMKTAISKLTKEENLDEISKDTLNSYVHKAFQHGNDLHYDIAHERDKSEKEKMKSKLSKRNDGVIKAAKKLREGISMLSFDDYLKEALHPNQVKLDKNKNGKLDAHDFKKLRKEDQKEEGFVSHAQRKAVWASKNEKGVKEEIELDEAAWGRDKMTNLRQAHDRHMEKALAANKAGDDEATKVHQRKMQMIQSKMQKLKQNEEVELGEECEILAELDKKTLGSYVKKAGDDYTKREVRIDRALSKDITADTKAAEKKQSTRKTGISRAVDKLTKEEVEQLDERDSYQTHKDNALAAKKSGDQLGYHKHMHAYYKNHAEDAYHDSYHAGGAGNYPKNMTQAKLHADKMKKLVKEAVEELDEISDITKASYIKKSTDDLRRHRENSKSAMKDYEDKGGQGGGYDRAERHDVKAEKRAAGIRTAVNKLTKEAVEELDELSKKTLNAYTSAARTAVVKHMNDYTNSSVHHGNVKTGAKHLAKAVNRSVGLRRATDKITKEEVEELDELNKSTLASYAKKATDDAALRARFDNRDQPSVSKKTIQRLHGAKKAIDKLAKEEAEQIDELSTSTLDNYRTKANSSGYNSKTTQQKLDNRSKGMNLAWSKTMPADNDKTNPNKAKVKAGDYRFNKEEFTLEDYSVEEIEEFMMSEDFEQLDEISKATLGSYVKKASTSLASNAMKAADRTDKKSFRKAVNRMSGIQIAADKLAKEEVEENIVEGRGPYMLYDPKHPHFASNYNKFKRANPTKGLSHFVDAMKKKEHGDKLKEDSDYNKNFGPGTTNYDRIKHIQAQNKKRYDSLSPEEKAKHDKASAQAASDTKRKQDNQNFRDKLKSDSEQRKNTLLRKEETEYTIEDFTFEEIEDFMMTEDFDQLDELSKKTLSSYMSKADAEKSTHMDASVKAKRAANNVGAMKDINVGHPEHAAAMRKAATDYHSSLTKDAEHHDAKWKKRSAGIKTAMGKYYKKEEVEELDEISKATLGSYVKKASADSRNKALDVGSEMTSASSAQSAIKKFNKSAKRVKGISTAVDKLTKEETENMKSYKDFMTALQEELDIIDEAKIDDLKDRMAAKKATQSAYDKDYKPSAKSNVMKVKGHSYGAGESDDNDDDEDTKKVSKPTSPEVKRGRGRPAGSKSGARN